MSEDQSGNAPEPRPFLEDGSQFGISEDAFKEMDIEDQRESILEWFRQNFEDPHNELPFNKEDGGYNYIYLWGGPFDAKEMLWDKFGDIVDENELDTIVARLERDGVTEWAPTGISPYYQHPEPDDDDDQGEPFQAFVERLPDEVGPAYRTKEDFDARKTAIEALAHLESVLPSTPAGIGHNKPPEEIDSESAEAVLRPIVLELHIEFTKDEPAVSTVKRLAAFLGTAVAATVQWVGHKLDVLIEEAVKSIGKIAGPAIVAAIPLLHPSIREGLISTLSALANWLHLITQQF